LTTAVTLFAQNPPAPEGGGPGGGGLLGLLPYLLVMGLLFYWLLIRPQKREQARRQSMLAAVKKNDRVLTSGGIYGVVTNVHREADEITVKVDEATNTKLRMTLGSIAQVLGDAPVDGADTKSQ
jgi:preprotein translocase subunit YajC